jgi:hypothetical protein
MVMAIQFFKHSAAVMVSLESRILCYVFSIHKADGFGMVALQTMKSDLKADEKVWKP